MHPIYWLLFVFFQAEDGIRDLTVTGVQTCALPILSRKADWRQSPPACRQSALRDTRGYDWALQSTWRRSCGAEISWLRAQLARRERKRAEAATGPPDSNKSRLRIRTTPGASRFAAKWS